MPDSLWDGAERRDAQRHPPGATDSDTDRWRYVSGQLESLGAMMRAMHIDMVGQKSDMSHIQSTVDTVQVDVELIKKAFPKDEEGKRDYDGHNGYHGGLMARSKTISKVVTEVVTKTLVGVTWATVLFIAYSIWESIKQEVKK